MSPTPARNTLGAALSPYLRQHADNPVHWQQWSAEALAEAAARDVPILLSIGYAACHWCHVMAHESFADPEVAAVANAGFVCIKVDREERPDLDAVYMAATVALTGQGGWPMTCFLTPDGRPFFCGTYYPKATFLQLLSAVSETWHQRRAEVEQASAHIAGELQAVVGGLPGGAPVTAEVCDGAIDAVLTDEDAVHGGFGGPPKFPPSALLEALLRHHERTGADGALQAAVRAGEAMARGGLYDQLAGGFARYSVDEAWVVPHFEKMLYDNALLLRVYAHWARRSRDPLPLRVTRETARFLLDDLRRDGLFVSSLDADAAGREGSTYVWTPAQLRDAPGDDAAWAAGVFGVTDAGTFERDASVLQLRTDPVDAERFAAVRAALRAVRAERPQPERDDKVVTAWNGLTITALCEAGVALAEPELIDAAAACADALLDLHLRDGRLRRTSLGGVVGPGTAILEDHAALATGLLTLHQVSGEQRWLESATEVLDLALDHFADPDNAGRWYDVADDAEQLLVRPADPFDGATPSGASLLAEALMLAAHLVPSDRAARYADAFDATLAAAAPVITGAPRSAGHWLAIAEAAVRGPIQIAVSCDDPSTSDLLATARVLAPGGAIVVGGPADGSELLRDRPRVAGIDGLKDAAYVCRGRVCDLPVRTADDLAAALGPSV
ncbi:thioredoxin domain-containing protein [Mycobacterium kyogaense]|uniref:thioredoxin domain-containing protein n=1 Tax=Mycobacterium kyogaense TaxID=2212479 RepID=UPI000DAD985F|nr:thioredoxin domain-containing protein [Mycobacterium kyogaense]